MWKQSDTQTGTKTNMTTGHEETLILMHVHVCLIICVLCLFITSIHKQFIL